MNKIEEALIKRFEEQRIIFWYDEKQEMEEQFQAIDLENVQKIHVKGNEFEIKYIVIKQQPKAKFLLYFSGPKPANEDNWLLDLELAHYVFQTDQEALFLQEMGLGYHLKELIAEHIEFFKAKERRNKLVEYLGDIDSHNVIRYKMLAIVFANENINLGTFIIAHAAAFIDNSERIDKDLERYNLSEFYWKEISRKYNYLNPNPSIYDLLLEIFANQFVLIRKPGLGIDTKLLLSNWKDTVQYRDYFGKVSEKIAEDLGIQQKLDNSKLAEIITDDIFVLSEQKILHELINMIIQEEITAEKLSMYIKNRENKYWFNEYAPFYNCLHHAIEMILHVKKYEDIQYKTFEEGTKHYAEHTYIIDYHYRKYIWNYRQTNQNKALASLSAKIEKVYSNDWLLAYNDKWQNIIDKLDSWPSQVMKDQRRFFEHHVKTTFSKKQKLFVIISDAFRYECGAELVKRIHSENRFEPTLDYMVSSIPSYTQLGMAALLPHKTISFQGNSDTISIDGQSTIGTQARAKILELGSDVNSTAITAEEFMKLNTGKEGRDFVKQYELIYIHNNRIDKAGDDKVSEDKVFDATEEELTFLVSLLKKIANVNGTNMMITADHGFIYQNAELSESDFAISDHKGNVWKENRRFVIGEGLENDSATKAFKAKNIGIDTEADILLPKSINRLRVKGAGSRFIHGGASLQEIMIPLIKISKSRQDTTTQVGVDIIKSTDRITSNLLVVSFIQTELLSDQILPRTLRAAIYAEDGEILSDLFKYTFDIEDGAERMREVKHRFQLSSKASGKYKNQSVKLILEEPIDSSTKWRAYKEYNYTLNISFANDFDD
jgi:uncharacterized protein (TIGR02687 family)